MEGRKHKLNLGWHILRNPGQMEMSDPATDRSVPDQDFFEHVASWKDLDEEKTSIATLKIRLQQLFAEFVRREFHNFSQVAFT